MNIQINTQALSMKADAYVVKNPHEKTNVYTKTDVGAAAEALNLTSELAMSEFKISFKGMTSHRSVPMSLQSSSLCCIAMD
jgi:hypothetical protein